MFIVKKFKEVIIHQDKNQGSAVIQLSNLNSPHGRIGCKNSPNKADPRSNANSFRQANTNYILSQKLKNVTVNLLLSTLSLFAIIQ